MYNAGAVGIRFPGNPKVYTYGIPARLQREYITRGSQVVVFSPLSGYEVVTVCEVHSHRPQSVRSFIQSLGRRKKTPTFEEKRKQKEREFDALLLSRVSSLSYRQKRNLVVERRLFGASELIRFSSVG